MKYRVKSTRDTLGYVTADSEHAAWAKARAKWGMLVESVTAV